MADSTEQDKKPIKSPHAEREERVLAFWNEKDIFKKTLEKTSLEGEFVFYEGPPTANGMPGIHHLEARAFKDAIPRYKTMQGFHVRRKGGWDTHGLPVELQVEKELGLKSKKEIETYGIEKFNEKCKESVWKYVHEWESFSDRIGYWVDLKDPYITYKPNYIESLWSILSKVDNDGLLYKDYKVVPWCPRCGTGLSSHELAQGYQDVKDLAVYVKFKIKKPLGKVKGNEDEYLLAWTTTPWTLPGNVALAVGKDIEYVRARVSKPAKVQAPTGIYEVNEGEIVYIAKSIIKKLPESPHGVFQKGDLNLTIVEEGIMGSDLIGLEYEPLYPFIKENITGPEKDKLKNAYKVYAADFVTTEDGTGIVHTAVMYGQDDFELGTKVGLPKYHLVNEDGTFKKETGFLAGKFVKDQETDVAIIKDLANRPEGSLLFHKEKYEHSYPHCWRCSTPLIYFARDSWYIRMSELRDKLIKANDGINWEPKHIKNGRFGEWLKDVKDWSISRERYWGTPLPIWICELCNKKKVVSSVAEVSQKLKNKYFVIRHGEAENNVKHILSGKADAPHHLTEKGKKQVAESVEFLKNKNIDLMFVSPFVRTRETADILQKAFSMNQNLVHFDERLRELGTGLWDGRAMSYFTKGFKGHDRFDPFPEGEIETFTDIKKRMGDFLYETEQKYKDKTILIVTHETPAFLLFAAAKGWDRKQSIRMRDSVDFIDNAQIRELDFAIIPHNAEYELDLHRPYIDEVKLQCSCGGGMGRVKEVIDVWFDSGAMPFAQDHYPFENKDRIDGGFLKKAQGYPADFISEAVDQTRGWFYTLHAIGVLLGKGKAYSNVICLGHILDAKGKKMSKSIGNVINPWDMMDKYGADALRFWMYSVNQPGESKDFDEKTVDEVVKKVFNLITNVVTFYKLYQPKKSDNQIIQTYEHSSNILDQWIIARLNELVHQVTENLDKYALLEATRLIRDFVADLSQWYIRRSRDRFKKGDDDTRSALLTTRYVLSTLSKVMAPFTPFFAEYLYGEIDGEKESVHLTDWPVKEMTDQKVLDDMKIVRDISSKGLEARMRVKINVRQPLATLKVQNLPPLDNQFLELIQDEINVKSVIQDVSIGDDVQLNLDITPELKEEGDLRELMRKIQDLRKEKSLSVSDTATLVLPNDTKDLVLKYENELKKATNISVIEFGDTFDVRK